MPAGYPMCSNCGYANTAAMVPPPARPASRKLIAVGAIVAALVVALGGFLYVQAHTASSANAPSADRTAIFTLLDANAAAMNSEDVEAYMDCVDPASPVYATTRTSMTAVFATYDVHVVGSDYEMVDLSATVAHVKATITTTKVSGPAFKDNRVTAVFEIHKVSGTWKIYGQIVKKVDYL